MKIASIQFVSWDNSHFYDVADFDLKKKDRVIVRTDTGTELGEVINMLEVDEDKLEKVLDSDSYERYKNGKLDSIIRLAGIHDTQNLPTQKEKHEALDFSKKIKERYDSPMKFVDVHFSFDGSKLTFAFIADGRVDFRAMVKEMTRHFGKTIRLQQIGIRDEAKIMGDVGSCGKNLCCQTHLKDLSSITSDMAEIQQCSHRGSDRISGVCGRLMCCLSYEYKCYEECAKRMPEIGRKVDVDGKKGVIVGQNIIKESVNVKFSAANGEGERVVEIDLNRNNKKK